MNLNILSLKYDIISLHEKVDKLDEIIRNNNVGYNKDESNFEADSFQTFENKLSDNSFRMKLVNYIF